MPPRLQKAEAVTGLSSTTSSARATRSSARQRPQLREAHRVVAGVEGLDAGLEVRRVAHALERGGSAGGVGGVEGELRRQVPGAEQRVLRARTEQAGARRARVALDLHEAAEQHALGEILDRE